MTRQGPNLVADEGEMVSGLRARPESLASLSLRVQKARLSDGRSVRGRDSLRP